jgi:hypothetical protein
MRQDTDVRTEETGAPTDVVGGMPATAGATAPVGLTDAERGVLAAVADHLIPAAHGMPSAAEVVNADRVEFVLRARPDLVEPLRAALRPDIGADVQDRLAALANEPTNLSALQLTIVGGYYTDKGVRELIGYPGQMAIEVKSWLVPEYIEEGHIDAVLARGPVWRDPRTGTRAVESNIPHTYLERFTETAPAAEAATAQGGSDGRDSA